MEQLEFISSLFNYFPIQNEWHFSLTVVALLRTRCGRLVSRRRGERRGGASGDRGSRTFGPSEAEDRSSQLSDCQIRPHVTNCQSAMQRRAVKPCTKALIGAKEQASFQAPPGLHGALMRLHHAMEMRQCGAVRKLAPGYPVVVGRRSCLICVCTHAGKWL